MLDRVACRVALPGLERDGDEVPSGSFALPGLEGIEVLSGVGRDGFLDLA